MIIPEFLQYDCTAKMLYESMRMLLNTPSYRDQLCARLKTLKHSLAAEQAETTLFQLIYDELNRE